LGSKAADEKEEGKKVGSNSVSKKEDNSLLK